MRKRAKGRAFATVAAAIGAVVALSFLMAVPAASERSAVSTARSKMSALAEISATTPPASVMNVASYVPGDDRHGKALPSESRRLLTHLGRNAVELYAYPTTTGAVCFVVLEAIAAGACADSFDDDDRPAAVAVFGGSGVPVTVAGVAPDGLAAASVSVDGEEREMSTARNALYYQLASDETTASVGALTLRFDGGRIVKQGLGIPAVEPEFP